MSIKMRHIIAGILALVMMISMTDYTGGIACSRATAFELNNVHTYRDVEPPVILGYRMSPTAELVGIYTLDPEMIKALEAIFAEEDEKSESVSTENVTEETDVTETEPSEEATEPNTTEPELESTEPETEAPLPSVYDGIAVITIFEEYLNVRAAGNVEAALVGRMYPGSQGTIIEQTDGWYHIVSGNVDGWISGKHVVTGIDAENFLKEHDLDTKITVATPELNVRAQADADSDCVGYVWGKDRFAILGQENGWYMIEFAPGQRGWVNGRFVSVGTDLGIAMTMAEVEAYEYQKALEAKAASVGAVLRGAMTATEEEVYLLAALLRHEAGYRYYEGCLAVANVVINRIHNGYWGKDIRSVIFAPGQFQYVEQGALDQWLTNPGEICLQAARDALAGINNVGDYLFFCSEKSASTRYDTFTSWINICGNVFYRKN